jgi:hypothetical protein
MNQTYVNISIWAKFKLTSLLSVHPSFEVTVLVLFSMVDYSFPFTASSLEATKLSASLSHPDRLRAPSN